MTEGRGVRSAAARAQGRYDSANNASSPGDLPREGKRFSGIHIVHGVVPEPNQALRLPGVGAEGPASVKLQRAAFNRDTDILERELHDRRISPAAFAIGRRYQGVLEQSRGHRTGGSGYEPKNHRDCWSAQEAAVIRGLQCADDTVAMTNATRSKLGARAEMLLTALITEEETFGSIARAEGYTSTHGRRKIGNEFREALEDLAVVWGRPGWPIR